MSFDTLKKQYGHSDEVRDVVSELRTEIARQMDELYDELDTLGNTRDEDMVIKGRIAQCKDLTSFFEKLK